MDNKKMEEYKDWDDITSPDEEANGKRHFKQKYYDGDIECIKKAVFSDGVLESEQSYDEFMNEINENFYYKNGNLKSKVTTKEQLGQFLQRDTEIYDKEGNGVISKINEYYDSLNGNANIEITDSEGKEMTLESLMEKDEEIENGLQLNFSEDISRDKDGKVKSITKYGEYNGMSYEQYEYYSDDKKVESGYYINDIDNYAKGRNFYDENGKIMSYEQESDWYKGSFTECIVAYGDTLDEKGEPSNELLVQYKKGEYGVDIDFLNAKFTKDSNLEELLERVRNNAPEVITQVERDLPTILDDIPLLKNSLDEPNNYSDKTQLEEKINANISEKSNEIDVGSRKTITRTKEMELKRFASNQQELDKLDNMILQAREKLHALEKKEASKENPNI